MCDGGLVAAGVMMAAMAAKTYMDQKQLADQNQKQRELMKEQAAFVEKAAKEARATDMEALEKREEQIEAKGNVQTFERVRQANREAAKLKLSSAESGVFGTSIYRQLATADIQEMHDIGLIKTNTQAELEQNELMIKKTEADYQSRLNDADQLRKGRKLYSGPSSWMSNAYIGLAAIQGMAQGYSMGSSMSGAASSGSRIPYIPAA